MKLSRWTIEHTLYTLAFLLALTVRFVMLGAAPLDNYESGWALQGLELARDQVETVGPSPAYILWSGFLFDIFGGSDFLARFLPALAGSLLVLAPVFFRQLIGRAAAILLAFLLALDPGIAAVSRTADGQMMALSFTILALGALVSRRPRLAGFLGGLALLAGPSFWHGLLVLALAWGLSRLLVRNQETLHPDGTAVLLSGMPWKAGAIIFGATAFLAGTLFFIYPGGVGGFASSLPAYLSSWVNASGVPPLRIPAALLLYQPLGVAFGLAAAVRAWVDRSAAGRVPRFLSLWFAAALFLSILRPGRQVDDLIWALVPLLGLAAVELVRYFAGGFEDQSFYAAAGQALLLVLIYIFVWTYLSYLSGLSAENQAQAVSGVVYLLVGSLAMSGIVFLLVGLGWSFQAALRGLSWGALILLGLYGLSALWGGIGLNANPRQELWAGGQDAGQLDLMMETLGDLAEWNSGRRDSLEVVVLADAPAVHWALKDWQGAVFATGLRAGEQPEAIISISGQEPPELAAAYAGQDFVFERAVDMGGALPPDFLDFLKWLIFRQAPVREEIGILWARTDLFPGGSLTSEITP